MRWLKQSSDPAAVARLTKIEGHDGASGSKWSGDGFWRVEDGKLKLSAKKKGPTQDFVFKDCDEYGNPARCLVPPDDASAVVIRPE